MLCERWRPSSEDADEGAVEELERIVGRIREGWPQVRVIMREDAGFCREELIAWCEAQEGVDCVLGLAQNASLQRAVRQPLDLLVDRTATATMRANQLRLHRAVLATAQVQVSVRRIRVSKSSLFPRQALFAHFMSRLRRRRPLGSPPRL